MNEYECGCRPLYYIYHDEATWTSTIVAHIANSISADLADCCTLPLTLSPYQTMDPSQFLGTYSLKCVDHVT